MVWHDTSRKDFEDLEDADETQTTHLATCVRVRTQAEQLPGR